LRLPDFVYMDHGPLEAALVFEDDRAKLWDDARARQKTRR
jgi:hypothetical protein